MANLPDVRFHEAPDGRKWVAIVTSAFEYSDGFRGCNWMLYDPDGALEGYGYSKGWDGQGAGSALRAHDNARAAARRRWRKFHNV